MIRIVLVDDHTLVRTGLRMIIDGQRDMEVVAEADDGEPGLESRTGRRLVYAARRSRLVQRAGPHGCRARDGMDDVPG